MRCIKLFLLIASVFLISSKSYAQDASLVSELSAATGVSEEIVAQMIIAEESTPGGAEMVAQSLTSTSSSSSCIGDSGMASAHGCGTRTHSAFRDALDGLLALPHLISCSLRPDC